VADRTAEPELGSGLQGAAFRFLWRLLGLGQEVVVDGRGPGRARSGLEITRHTALHSLIPTVVVRDGDRRYAFRCTRYREFKRAARMLERERGTIEWLTAEVRPGDVFYDIGANIGVFTVFAASRIGDGQVYAFEPHLVNAARLLVNVGLNGLEDVVRVLSCPLSDRSGVATFDYGTLEVGTSSSRLSDQPAGGVGGTPELKVTATVDELLADGALRPPGLVKIDVDGHELSVLRGMAELLGGAQRPRAVQVEVNLADREEVCDLMRERGYDLTRRHHSIGAARLLEAGTDPDQVPFNGIFRPASAG
jgi:FkbM family methyltransferase